MEPFRHQPESVLLRGQFAFLAIPPGFGGLTVNDAVPVLRQGLCDPGKDVMPLLLVRSLLLARIAVAMGADARWTARRAGTTTTPR